MLKYLECSVHDKNQLVYDEFMQDLLVQPEQAPALPPSLAVAE